MKHRESKIDWIQSFYDSAADWWGTSWYSGENLQGRLEVIQQFGNPFDKRILELGAGTGETASYLCDHGYSVTAVDICKRNIEFMREMQKEKPSLRIVEGDFLKVRIEEKCPTICMFETFGMGSDDGIKNRWIDVWEPINDKESARIQSIRCYSAADLLLLLMGTGFSMQKIIYKGEIIDFENDEIRIENAFEDCERNFYYTAVLKGKMKIR